MFRKKPKIAYVSQKSKHADELGRQVDNLIPQLMSEASGLHAAKVQLRNALIEEIVQHGRNKI